MGHPGHEAAGHKELAYGCVKDFGRIFFDCGSAVPGNQRDPWLNFATFARFHW
jgi:hypothetical protein